MQAVDCIGVLDGFLIEIFAGGRAYDPFGSRFMTENPAGVMSGETNLYAMPGRTSAANLFAGGRSDGINHSAGGSESFAGQFFSFERMTGLAQAVGGVVETLAGVAYAIPTGGVSVLAALKGVDDAIAGYRQFVTGEYQQTFTHQAAYAVTGNETFATSFDFATSISLSAGSGIAKAGSKASSVTRSFRTAAFGSVDNAAAATIGRAVRRSDDFFRMHQLPLLDTACFVAGTAVHLPIDPSAVPLAQIPEVASTSATNAPDSFNLNRFAVGLVTIAVGAMGWAAMQDSRRDKSRRARYDEFDWFDPLPLDELRLGELF